MMRGELRKLENRMGSAKTEAEFKELKMEFEVNFFAAKLTARLAELSLNEDGTAWGSINPVSHVLVENLKGGGEQQTK